MSHWRTVKAKRSSNASTAAIRTMRTSTRPRTSSAARYTQPAWTMPRAWRDTLPVKPMFHGRVPLKRRPLLRVWEDPSTEERVSYATGIPRLQPWGGSQVRKKAPCALFKSFKIFLHSFRPSAALGNIGLRGCYWGQKGSDPGTKRERPGDKKGATRGRC